MYLHETAIPKPTEEFGTRVLELACMRQSQLCASLPNTVLGNLTSVTLSWLQPEVYTMEIGKHANQRPVSSENSY